MSGGCSLLRLVSYDLCAVGIKREDCTSDIFTIIAGLHQNKILGRLRCTWFIRRGSQHSGPPPTRQLKEYLASLVSSDAIRDNNDYLELQRQTQELHDAFDRLENRRRAPLTHQVTCIPKLAFATLGGQFSLRTRLEGLGIDSTQSCVEKIDKLANYFRIARNLTDLSRSYRAVFQHLKVVAVDRFGIYRLPNTNLKTRVHAEIQMIVYYEKAGGKWPRAIGASKAACFLCHAFVNEHGFFHLSKAHRQPYSLWNVPDLVEYSEETLERFRNILVAVDSRVRQEIEMLRVRGHAGPDPTQSLINMLPLNLDNISLSTGLSSSTTRMTRGVHSTDATSPVSPVVNPETVSAMYGDQQRANTVTPTRATNTTRIEEPVISWNMPTPPSSLPLPLAPPSAPISRSPQHRQPEMNVEHPTTHIQFPSDEPNTAPVPSRHSSSTLRPPNEDSKSLPEDHPISSTNSLQGQAPLPTPNSRNKVASPLPRSPLQHASRSASPPIHSRPFPFEPQSPPSHHQHIVPHESGISFEIDDWLTLHASLSPPPLKNTDDSPSPGKREGVFRGLIAFEPLDSVGGAPAADELEGREEVVDVWALRAGEEVTLPRSRNDRIGYGGGSSIDVDASRENRVSFVMAREPGGGRRVRVVCEWVDE